MLLIGPSLLIRVAVHALLEALATFLFEEIRFLKIISPEAHAHAVCYTLSMLLI